MPTPSKNQSHEGEIEALWDKVSPLVDKMRAKYPKELNIDGFEPALTSDIVEIVLHFQKDYEAKVVEDKKKTLDEAIKIIKKYKPMTLNYVDCVLKDLTDLQTELKEKR